MTERELQYAGEEFCNKHILAKQTNLVERLISLDEIGTYSILIEKAEVFDPNQDKLVEMTWDEYNILYNKIQDELSEMYEDNLTSEDEKLRFITLSEFVDNEPYFEYINIFGWYLVSDYLERMLEKEGEVILKTEYGNWWGRRCTGQSFQSDSVLRKIIIESNK